MNLKKMWKKLRLTGDQFPKGFESLKAFAHRVAKDPATAATVTAWFKGKKNSHKVATKKPRISQRAGKLAALGGKKKKNSQID